MIWAEVRKLELKKRSQISGYWLHYWEGAIGPLERVWKEDDSLNAKIGKITLILPVAMEKTLAPLVGRTISILRSDLPGKEFLVLPDFVHETESMTAHDHCGNNHASNCCEMI